MDEGPRAVRLSLGQAADVRLGRQRAPQYEQGDHVVPYLRSANVADGVLNLSDVKQMNFTPLEQTIFGLEEGDVLLTEGSGSRDTVGTSAVWRNEMRQPVCFQNTLLRLRPRPGVTEGRFLAWWARHARTSGQIAAVSAGANILHIGSDGLKRLTMQVPPVEEQLRIAEFLDDRVSRIDRIIGARTKQIALATECRNATAYEEFSKSAITDAPRPRLAGACTFFQDGDWVESPFITDSGIRLIQTGNIGIGEYREQGYRFISPQTFVLLGCTSVHAGDVLISRLAQPVGRACLAPDLGRMVTSVDVAIARPHEWLQPQYLVEFLSSPKHLSDTSELARGSTLQRVSRSQLGSVKIPVPDPKVQSDIVAKLSQARQEMKLKHGTLQRSIDLMTEYKSSLITAAVTGELDVSTAGSSIPG